ncbi:hypothetical protein G6011_01875 [Alternaria panax]|uniref:Uncharacterized protein n=1 Tax=Alternaria panax TaxID=48097 RepID=A0AAD4FDQ0_9PLEO|nr:hypothetical protein G6011_01875 [Alternaria panax]
MLLLLPIAILLVAMLSPIPYDIRWTAKLLRRDVRVLRTKLATSLKRKVNSDEVAESSSLHYKGETKRVAEVLEGVQHIDELPQYVNGGSVYSKAPEDAPEIVPEPDRDKCNGTPYELLEGRLRAVYASRDRDASHKDRWRFRGSWLLLHKAIQACPSNDSWGTSLSGTRDDIEKRMLLEMLQLSTDRTRSPLHKVSRMPAAPYTQHDSDLNRFDSMLSNATTLTSTPSAIQMWLSILEATNDATKIAPMAEELLQYIWSEKKATAIIEQIGDPHKKFSDADDAELRVQLRQLLRPEFIFSTPCR